MAKWQTPKLYKRIDLDGLRAKCDLRELIAPHLEKAKPVSGGEYWVACCPFHNDKRPSFLVFKDGYRCESANCGEWGDVVNWYSHFYPNLGFGELLEKIENEYAYPLVKTPQPRWKPIRLKEEPLPKFMNPTDLDDYTVIPQRGWFRFPKIREWIQEHWLLNDETIHRERLGWDDEVKAIIIPVWGRNYEELITLRFRNVANPNMGRYWGIRGRNGIYGYGRRWIENAEYAIIVFGEMTALFLHQWGFTSFSWTNGCKSFRPYLKMLLAPLKGGVVVPDIGEEDQAFHIANLLGVNWEIACLDTVWDGEGDVIDWIKKGGGTRGKFCDLIINKTVRSGEIRRYWENHSRMDWRR